MWWTEQAEHIERDRHNLRYLWVGAIPATAAAFYFGNWKWALGSLAVASLGFVQGLYLCTVHRWEYQYNLKEARRDLWTVRASALRRPKRRRLMHANFVPPHPQAGSVTRLHRPDNA